MSTTIDIEDLIRKLPLSAFPDSAQRAVDELFAKKAPPLTVEQRKRFIAAAERPLKVRREILNLAAAACGHRCGAQRTCRECHGHWPCEATFAAAKATLDAVAALS